MSFTSNTNNSSNSRTRTTSPRTTNDNNNESSACRHCCCATNKPRPPATPAAGVRRRKTQIWTTRILFLTCLVTVAACLGIVVFRLLQKTEIRLATDQFASIADRALASAQQVALRNHRGTVSLASVASNAAPDAATWPFVNITGYEEIATNVIETSNGKSMGLCPLVTPDQLQDFEDFAYRDVIEPKFGNETAVHSFGRGVFGMDFTLNNSEDFKFHESDGVTTWGSPNTVLAPFLFHNSPVVLMGNYRTIPERGRLVDQMIDCAKERAQSNNPDDIECGILTDVVILGGKNKLTVDNPPSSIVLQPIYPANNKTVLTGFITSTMVWDTVLENVFADEVRGVDCVLETETQTFTYHIMDGVATYLGEGDFHNDAYVQHRQTIPLTTPGIFSITSPSYKLVLYPNDHFFQVYSTNNPTIAAVVVVGCIIATSLLFVLYDFFVRQEFHARKALLESKRQFVRFVSHEVRTPLNAVCMGLQLLQEELKGFWDEQQQEQQQQQQQQQQVEHNNSNHNNGMTLVEGDVNPGTRLTTAAVTTTTTPNAVDNDTTKEKQQAFLDLARDIVCSADSAVDVLTDLLDFDKIEVGAMSLEITIIPFWNLIEQAATEFKIQAIAKDIDFDLDFSQLFNTSFSSEKQDETTITTRRSSGFGVGDVDPKSATATDLPADVRYRRVLGDTIRLTQVLRNLFSNALKFTPGKGHLTVSTSWEKPIANNKGTDGGGTAKTVTLCDGEQVTLAQSGRVLVSVTDTGAGMTPEQLLKLFSDGVQFNVNQLQAGKGSGLGLFIAKGIMEQHGGTLTADSNGLGRGTTFTMTLPLYFVPDESLPPTLKHLRLVPEDTVSESVYDEEKAMPSVWTPPVAESLRILVVDDALTNRKMLMRLLQRRNHYCDEAKDGIEAVDKVKNALQQERPYDTILMDYEMPEMDGPEASKQIRALGCDSFIVGVTGNLLPEDVAHFKACGVNAVFPKPLNLTVLEELWVEYGVTGVPRLSSETP